MSCGLCSEGAKGGGTRCSRFRALVDHRRVQIQRELASCSVVRVQQSCTQIRIVQEWELSHLSGTEFWLIIGVLLSSSMVPYFLYCGRYQLSWEENLVERRYIIRTYYVRPSLSTRFLPFCAGFYCRICCKIFRMPRCDPGMTPKILH